MTAPIQLTLPIQQADDLTLQNFCGENNPVLLDSLFQALQQRQQQFFYLYGEHGSGKSHLLKACCHLLFDRGGRASFIPLKQAAQFSPDVLDNLETQDLVCIDDLQTIAGQAKWETALFDLYNRIKEQGKTILMLSAAESPRHLPLELNDLRSRLSWGEIHKLQPLDERQKLKTLQQRAYQRGLELPDEVGLFLLKRLERDSKSLFDTLQQLDQASLQAQRKLTIPFVKHCLQL
ncbi:regulatory inactivation of DnaA Hda protein [Pasteurella testudinis DSM 23072]|uniref:Regulatory inactivation of DnaA Hda protein n=1 Tax=Pasteurella testudinis DSM 23072 TaxID=1122938 RepID=A0A1W1URW9_9PAST|nr:DnaA inactivator Hda [Pasteurella testudinis]SMB83769.1 regulatory inactivation of DnaA Hda protein [Pasteurella testudinis DSM 23072]SUB50978.1 chromosomal replication control, initiator (DnaA)/regulator (Hda) [Pasteurella testudinis]